jgi:hypothetical protein
VPLIKCCDEKKKVGEGGREGGGREGERTREVGGVKENGILVYFIDMKVVNIYKGLSMIIGDKYQKT